MKQFLLSVFVVSSCLLSQAQTITTSPVPVSPSGNISSKINPLTFSCRKVTNATKYRFQVFSNTTLLSDSIQSDTFYTPGYYERLKLTEGNTYTWKVAAANANSEGPYSSLSTFKLVKPFPLTYQPYMAAQQVSTTPSFSWQRIKNTTKYRVRVYTASNALAIDTVRSDTFFQVSASRPLIGNATSYKWQVAALDGDNSLYGFSDFSTFTTIGPPSHPVGHYPTGPYFINGTSGPVPFDWNPSAGATHYHLQVSSSGSFATFLINDSTLAMDFWQDPKVMFQVGQVYYFRVRAKNQYGWSAFSFPLSLFNVALSPPWLQQPQDNQQNVSLSPRFQWSKVNGATAYRFMLLDSVANRTTIDTLLAARDTSFVPLKALVQNRDYQWQVSALYNTTSSTSTKNRFKTQLASTPSLPTTGQRTSNGSYVRISASNPWGEAIRYYVAEWSAQRNFATILKKDSVTGNISTYTSNNLILDKWYYVRIRAFNDFGVSPYKVDSVYNKYVPPYPGLATRIAPANNSVNTVLTPTILWKKASDATSYELYLRDIDSVFFYTQADLIDTSFKIPAGVLSPNKSYQWYVNSRNSVGTTYQNWDWFYFTTTGTGLPLTPSPITPNDTTFVNNTSPVIHWAPVAGASSYCLQVSRDSAFSDRIVDQCGLTQTSYTIPKANLRMEAVRYDDYHWKVAAVNAGGQGYWTAQRSFRISDIATSLDGNELQAQVLVAPNPFSEALEVKSTRPVASMRLLNTQGVTVAETGNSQVLATDFLPSGIYVLELLDAAGTRTYTKVLKK